VGLTPNILFN